MGKIDVDVKFRKDEKERSYKDLAGKYFLEKVEALEELRSTTAALVQMQKKVTELTERIQVLGTKVASYEQLEDRHGEVDVEGEVGEGSAS